jgi:hypothetical protein
MNYIAILIVLNQLILSSGGMNTNNMSKRVFSLSLLLLLMLILTASSASATDSGVSVSDVVRTLPDSVTPNTEFTVVLEIEGDSPLVVGIVENIPSGLSFPADDEDICSSCDFGVDRDNMTIAFSAIEVNTISYTLVSSSTGVYDFSGEWVDLLYQDVEIDVLANRLEAISGDSVFEVAESSETGTGSGSNSGSGSSGSSTGSSLQTIPANETESPEVVAIDLNAASEGEEDVLKSTDDSGSSEGVDGTESSADTATENNEGVESSANSTPGFSIALSCFAFVLSLAVVGIRRRR